MENKITKTKDWVFFYFIMSGFLAFLTGVAAYKGGLGFQTFDRARFLVFFLLWIDESALIFLTLFSLFSMFYYPKGLWEAQGEYSMEEIAQAAIMVGIAFLVFEFLFLFG
jgi:hypothetical protein